MTASDYPDFATPQANAEQMLSGNVGVTTDIATEFLATKVGVTTDISEQMLAGNVGVTTDIGNQMKAAKTGVTTEIAALIATGSAAGAPGGVPLLGSSALLLNQGNTLLSASASTTLGPFDVTGITYEVLVGIQQVAAANYSSTVSVTLNWFDSATGIQTHSRTWWLCGVSTGFQTYWGHGIAKGDELEVVLSNSDATNNARYEITLIQGSRIYARDDEWENLTFATPVSGSKPNSDTNAGLLAEVSVSLTTGQGVNRNLPLYNGLAAVSFSTSSGLADAFVTVLANDPNMPVADQTLFHGATNAQGYANFTGIPMIRATGYMIIQNTNAATQTVTVVLTAERQPL